ncbi:serine/threonine-protein kinase [Streptomyces sp. NPDC097981]|uniref:serine/threonine-protein kinase n=1 Tax=Streptomyces sp. NPDC097981 TaxID=3155428 RepID=UPI00332406AD
MQPLTDDDPRWLGNHRLLYRLGAGGMGAVYLGRSPGGRTVAVKVVRADLAADPGFRARFAREVRASRALTGPGTVPMLDSDTEAAVPWLASAYVPGHTLFEALDVHGPLPEATLWRLLAGLAQALEGVHAAEVIHRDVKPSNVLLAQDGPLLIDFGIARSADETVLTGTGTVVGSPGYMSPEQAEGQRVGPASDVFSLGASLAFAATGRNPFGTGSAAQVFYRVVHHEPDIADVPPDFADVLRSCLAKEPGRRPAAAALRAAAEERRPASGDWLPAPITASIARTAEFVLHLETPEGHEPPARQPRTPTAVLTVPDRDSPGRSVSDDTAPARPADHQSVHERRARAATQGPGPLAARAAWEHQIATLTKGLGHPLLMLLALLPVGLMWPGEVKARSQSLAHPNGFDDRGLDYEWALDDWWRVLAVVVLGGLLVGLLVTRGALSRSGFGAVRGWLIGVGTYWFLACGSWAAHIVGYAVLDNATDLAAAGGNAMPALLVLLVMVACMLLAVPVLTGAVRRLWVGVRGQPKESRTARQAPFRSAARQRGW